MATIDAFQIAGMKIWFWSNDHDPPHFHAKRAGEWEVKVSFLLDRSEMIELVLCEKDRSKKALNELTKLAEDHRADLLRQWEELRATQG